MADGAATTGPAPAGWIDSGLSFPEGDASQKYGDGWNAYIGDMKVTEFGLLPAAGGGTETTKYCDRIYTRPGFNRVAIFGGSACDGSYCGAFACALNLCLSYSGWNFGASPSRNNGLKDKKSRRVDPPGNYYFLLSI